MPPGARLVLKRPVTINVPKIVRGVSPAVTDSSPLAESQSLTPQSSTLQPSVSNGVTNEVGQSPVVMIRNNPEPFDNSQSQQNVSTIYYSCLVLNTIYVCD